MAKKLFCPKCGAQFSEGDLFCVECGNKIELRKSQESVKTVPDVETEQEYTQHDAQANDQPKANEIITIRRGDSVLIDNWWNPRGVLLLTSTALSFTSVGRKRNHYVEIPLKDVELAKHVFSVRFIILLRNKQFLFSVESKQDALEWIKQINDSVNAAKNGSLVSAVKQRTDYIDEIKRLKELADAGIISEAEFEAKKKTLLGL